MLQIKMEPERLVDHFRDVTTTLTSLGCGPKTRAALLQKAAQTLKQYGTEPSSAQHRLVPPADLDTLRKKASDLHWDLVDHPVSRWFGAEGYTVARGIRPKRYTAVGHDGLIRCDSTFLPRVIEIADNWGGWVQTSRDRKADLIPHGDAIALVGSDRFAERSRRRRAAHRLRVAGRPEVIVVIALRHGYGEHSIGQIGAEYERWRCPPKPGALLELEAAAQEAS
ncbi:hypothetical protein C3Y89_24525 [Rhizobium sp. UPM1132]|uniref:hypothetical protein n=1 Tax=Rhizobium ruizarguesonis TaxID=2081791 RepID=UPI001444CE79|nr:hypothetical protein [Rhizobium ruizarguesonis]NKQ73463.1 hypothetical protein [Rhizobium ruizarguesonis]